MDETKQQPGTNDSVSAERCRAIGLSAAAVALATDMPIPGRFLLVLLDGEHYADAIHFVAHFLTKRQAVWWGCMCAWEVDKDLTPDESAAMAAAIAWARDPTEANRRAAEQKGNAVGANSPAGALALAGFWSGGSMSSPKLPEVAPPQSLTAVTVANAVIMAATADPERFDERSRQFIAFADEVTTYDHIR